MPDSDGISIKENFEKRRKNTRIIFLTSHTERVLEAFGKNVLFFLRKPLNRQEFIKAMDKVMRDINEVVIEVEENGKSFIFGIQQIKYIEVKQNRII